MKVIMFSIFVLIAFTGFAQKGDTLAKHLVKKQYLSKLIGLTDTNRPLIFINNTIYNGEMDSIDMNKVKFFEVYKNADAVEIWGKKAANGTVKITTKNAQVDNLVLPPSTAIKGIDLIIVDGEPYAHRLEDLNPAEIFKIDVLKHEKIADFGGNANSVTMVITKKRARLSYQNNLAAHCGLYGNYLKHHTYTDANIKYLLNDKTAHMESLYNLKPDNISRVTFNINSNNPVVKIITK